MLINIANVRKLVAIIITLQMRFLTDKNIDRSRENIIHEGLFFSTRYLPRLIEAARENVASRLT